MIQEAEGKADDPAVARALQAEIPLAIARGLALDSLEICSVPTHTVMSGAGPRLALAQLGGIRSHHLKLVKFVRDWREEGSGLVPYLDWLGRIMQTSPSTFHADFQPDQRASVLDMLARWGPGLRESRAGLRWRIYHRDEAHDRRYCEAPTTLHESGEAQRYWHAHQ